jgi:hypothetical protein
MQELHYLAGHAQYILNTLTPEQASAVVKSSCAIGGLLLQYLSFRRGKKEQ